MKVIIVDDEPLALSRMEKLLNETAGVQITGVYQNPMEVIEALKIQVPEVIFMDIEMPGMNGVELARQIQKHHADLQIIFTTAFRQHALEAYDLHAADYIVKPIQSDRLAKAITRVAERIRMMVEGNEQGETVSDQPAAMIHMLGTFEVQRNQGDNELIYWRTRKVKELFAYLLQHKGQLVRKDALIEMLWPNYEMEKGINNLYTTAYQLRRVLQKLEIGIDVIGADEGYRMELNNTLVDVEEWERAVLNAPELTERTIDMHLKLLNLYRGPYLHELDYHWAVGRRHQLAMLWYSHAVQVGTYLMEKQEYALARSIYEKLERWYPEEAIGKEMLLHISQVK